MSGPLCSNLGRATQLGKQCLRRHDSPGTLPSCSLGTSTAGFPVAARNSLEKGF
jgi:hypothetical protein